jgi:hypothetical protein
MLLKESNAEVERLRAELDELRDTLDHWNLEIEKVRAERDDIKAEFQLVREQTAKAARIMIEETERVVARRAVEVCEANSRSWAETYAKLNSGSHDPDYGAHYADMSMGAEKCAYDISAEFNLDQPQDSSPVGSETGEKHAQTAGNDK